MSPVLWIVFGLLAVVLLAGIYLFNRLVALRTRVDNGWSQIDVQLRRRCDRRRARPVPSVCLRERSR